MTGYSAGRWISANDPPKEVTDPPTEYLTWNNKSDAATVCRYEGGDCGYGPWLDARELMSVNVDYYSVLRGPNR